MDNQKTPTSWPKKNKTDQKLKKKKGIVWDNCVLRALRVGEFVVRMRLGH